MRVGLIGTGVVGRRAARELVLRPDVDAVVLLTGVPKERARLRDSLGAKADASPADDVDDAALRAAALDVVVLCSPDEVQVDHARLALAAGCHVVSLADSVEAVELLFSLEDYARELGCTVIVGAALSPGWGSVLVGHAAALFDEIDEVSIAVTGSAGPACEERRSRAARTDTQEWREGAWTDVAARSGPELVWFPEPLAAIDCARGDLSEGVLVHRLLPDVAQIVVKIGRPSVAALPRKVRRLRRTPPPVESGGVRVAVSGRAGGQPSTVVYGLVAPAAAASAVLAALAVSALADAPAGVRGVGEVVVPVATLRSAAERGVSSYVYDGID